MNMDSEFVHIQGIPVPKGQPPGLRQEFSTWSKDSETSYQVSLFIRALQKFYDTDHTQRLSYFQVAGIHGFPGNLRWDNSDPPTHSWGKNHNLYCTHNLVTFPTWHRAYLLLFEQTLYNLMGEIIQNDPKFKASTDTKRWEAEREGWRLPYWDWAHPIHGASVPALFQTEQISIRVPETGKPGFSSETVSNPLYRYQLKVKGVLTTMGKLEWPYTVDDIRDRNDNPVFPSAECSGTSRWGITSQPEADWSGGVNNYSEVASAIDQHDWYTWLEKKDNVSQQEMDAQTEGIQEQPLSDLVYRLLSGPEQAWIDFSSTVSHDIPRKTPWDKWISLEYIHNNLHGFIGGSATGEDGHMAHVPVAAFDPIFYMHHANIDRLLAIWQTLNQETWFADTADPPADSPLMPFHHEFQEPTKKVDYFKSNDLRYWSEFGYQYDHLERQEDESDDEYIKGIKKYISDTYTNTGDMMVTDKAEILGDRPGNTYNDYIIDVLYDRLAMNGDSYTIHFFLGNIDNSEIASITNFVTHPKHVGSVYNFSTPLGPRDPDQPPACENCAQQQEAGILSIAQIPLTIPLYQEAAKESNENINHLGSSEVEHYLADELNWIAVSARGEQIPWEQLSRTKVYVLKGKAQHFEEATRLSKYEEYEPLYNVTEGKPAGASHVDYNFS